MTQDRVALGAFLRSRRDGLTPAQAGIAALPGARRVPGLRKDELAVLAGCSPDYYSRLEQGRQANISDEVLGALARALRLTDVERAHLHDLAAPTSRSRTTPDLAQRPDPGLLRLLATLDSVPALLLGRRGNILARNALLRAVLGRPMAPGSSFMHFLFRDPLARERIINWADYASTAVAALRRESARYPQDRRLQTFIEGLCATDADVAQWWHDHTVRDYTSVAKRIAHPTAGQLSFDVEVVVAPHNTDHRLIVYTTTPNSPTANVLPILASWDTDTAQPAT